MSDLTAETTSSLLDRLRQGDAAAASILLGRYLPQLRRWAAGRLPRWARTATDTDDLVQDAVMHSLRQLDAFEHRHDGALQAYLRQAVWNRIRNEIRRAHRKPAGEALPEELRSTDTSPLEATIGQEALDAYETALASLSDGDREAIINRIELGHSYAELAVLLGKPSTEAARKSVVRAIERLRQRMSHAGRDIGPA